VSRLFCKKRSGISKKLHFSVVEPVVQLSWHASAEVARLTCLNYLPGTLSMSSEPARKSGTVPLMGQSYCVLLRGVIGSRFSCRKRIRPSKKMRFPSVGAPGGSGVRWTPKGSQDTSPGPRPRERGAPRLRQPQPGRRKKNAQIFRHRCNRY